MAKELNGVRSRRQRNVSFTEQQQQHASSRENGLTNNASSPDNNSHSSSSKTYTHHHGKQLQKEFVRQRANTSSAADIAAAAAAKRNSSSGRPRRYGKLLASSPTASGGGGSSSVENNSTLHDDDTATHVLEVLTQSTPFGAMALHMTHDEPHAGPVWSELSLKRRVWSVLKVLFRLVLMNAFFYLFICSLSLLSDALRVLAGRQTNSLFNSELLRNPVVCVMIGLLVTVTLHSSSTSTSVTIAMVAAGVLPVEYAVYIVMGANIGTTVTSTCVSLVQSGDREEFRRAFAGATLGSMFNWLSVLIFLPLEICTGFLKFVSGEMVKALRLDTNKNADRAYLKALTYPATRTILQLNKTLLNELAESTDPHLHENTSVLADTDKTHSNYLFANTGLSDTQIGIIIGLSSLLLLCTALVGLVKTLHSMLGGRLALVVKRMVNAQLPGPLQPLTGYFFIAFAVGCTILIHSSSIFTSTLTPLVGIGIVSLERMYTFTLGSDLGTTLTGMLAALASDAQSINVAMQVAFSHLIFNVAGIVLFYPIPFMRWPVMLSAWMGDTTARYRWFPIFYIIVLFVVLPGAAILLSLAGTLAMLIVGGPMVVAFFAVVVVNVVQNKCPACLPHWIRDRHFLPEWLRSLEPYDRAIVRLSCYRKIAQKHLVVTDEDNDNDERTRDLSNEHSDYAEYKMVDRRKYSSSPPQSAITTASNSTNAINGDADSTGIQLLLRNGRHSDEHCDNIIPHDVSKTTTTIVYCN